MKVFRRLAHLASVIAPVLLLASIAAPQAPARQRIARSSNLDMAVGSAGSETKADPRGTTKQPLVVNIAPPLKSDQETAKEQQQNQQRTEDRDFSKRIAFFTAIVALLQVGLLGYQIHVVSGQNKILTTQTGLMTEQKTASADAAKAAAESVIAANSTLATNQEIERAYITMSYRDLLFLNFKEIHPNRSLGEHGNPDSVDLVVELKNIGRTPGDIMGGWCGLLYQTAHTKPKLLPTLDTSSVQLSRLFMLPNQPPLDFGLTIMLSQIELLFLRDGKPKDGSLLVEGKRLAVMDTMWLWLVGEIHYRDRFGHFHWAGYATRWDREAKRFLYDRAVSDLNYDRPMTAEEMRTRAYEN